MSAFYDLASLVLVPSGYKASKVYAQKPLTTDGQLTFSRASTATRVNSAGLIETVSSNVPRLDYQGSTCPKLLLEPSRTNVYLNSEDLTAATWTKTSCTISANAGAAPDGTTTADKLVMNNGVAPTSAGADGLYQVSIVTSGVYTVSFFAKAAEFSSVNVRDNAITGAFLNINLTTGAVTNPAPSQFVGAKAVNYGNGWYRVSFTTATVVATQAFSIRAGVTGDGTGGFLLWGLQFELGAYETSYVKTTSAAVTRLADACSKTGISSLIGQTEGTLFVEFVWKGHFDSFQQITIYGSSANRLGVYTYDVTNTLRWFVIASGSTLFETNISSALVIGQRYKLAIAYKTGDLVAYINGTQTFASSASLTFNGALNDVYFDTSAGTSKFTQPISQALLFKTRLTNAQLAELTTL